jgi:hypothetical protein
MNEVMMICIDDFARVIKLMTPRNKVSSLIAAFDARLMKVGFRNNFAVYDEKHLFLYH